MSNSREMKKQMKLLPAYVPLVLWLVFCLFTVGWLFCASLSTTREIFGGELLKSGLHFENYVKAWVNNKIAQYFMNSVIYATVSCAFIVLIAAPAAYVIAKRQFKFRGFVKSLFVIGMSIPSIMLVIPMYSVLMRLGMVGHKSTMILLYVSMSIPYTVYFLISFFFFCAVSTGGGGIDRWLHTL